MESWFFGKRVEHFRWGLISGTTTYLITVGDGYGHSLDSSIFYITKLENYSN
jgi:hypothetical protein